MTSVAKLSDAKVLLLAVHLATENQIDCLRSLSHQRSDVLRQNTVYRILLSYCAQDAQSHELISLLKDLQNGVDSELPADVDTSLLATINDHAVRKQVRALSLPPLPASSSDELLCFFQARAAQLDNFGDDLIPLAELVVPFLQQSAIRDWFLTRLRPLLRLKYEFYPGSDVTITLHDMDTLSGRPGVSTLMQYSEKEPIKAEVGRDLRSVVAPWIYRGNGAKRRKLDTIRSSVGEKSDWDNVNDWILATSLKDLGIAEKAYLEWNGPEDVDLGGHETPVIVDLNEVRMRYGQVGLAMIYASTELPSDVAFGQYRRILSRASQITGISPLGKGLHLSATSKAGLLQNALLRPDNELTLPTASSLATLNGMIDFAVQLSRLGSPLTVRQVAEISLFGTEEQQRQELLRITQYLPLSKASQYQKIREDLLGLQSWGNDPRAGEGRSLLGRLMVMEVESEILNAMLSARQYDAAAAIYAREDGPLSLEIVEDRVTAAIFKFYDNASNGNRTRGGILRAHEILKAFQPHFPESTSLREINKLIAATHSLSFYQLTLHQGVPFQPVDIRVRNDPISLIEKVLEQNQKAYTKLDDLLGIGRNLVEAGLTPESLESRILEAERRITYMAIKSSLTANDFETAYSYTTTRLSSSASDNFSWRAAFLAGRYRPPSTPPSIQSQISGLSRRMELLSLALTLAPTSDPLPEILAVWRLYEDKMDALKIREVERNRAFDQKIQNRVAGSVIPGGFGSEELDREQDLAETRAGMEERSMISFEDEAPMGLFQVARGAANAFQRSTKGVWGQPRQTGASKDEMLQKATPDVGGRKRDRIGGIVTGGLVNGLGWVLGAQPVGGEREIP